jgi:hypothetical protein
MKYYTADSYKGYSLIGEPYYNKSGKLVSMAECKCDRCHKGVYVCRVENGQPIPHPAYGGVCLRCGGAGVIRKEIRLYTESEYNAMQRAKDRAREKKDAEMRADAERKQAEWLRRNGFNAEGYTYIVKGETYSIKDKLKDDGFKFDPVFMWHQSQVPAGYEDKVVTFHYNDLVEFSAWGTGHYLTGAKEKVQNAVNPPEEQPNSEWLEGDKVINLCVTFVKKNGFQGRFGWTNIFTFQDENDNVLIWFTATEPDIKLGDNFFISGNIKDRTEYKGLKQTILTRVKIS